MPHRLLILIPLILARFAVAQTTSTQAVYHNLGPQIASTTLQGSTFTQDPTGKPLICTVLRGVPAKLIVFELDNPKPLHVLPLPNADGAWNAATASDHSVYIGTDPKGYLYRYIPGESTVHEIGTPPPAETWIWDVTPGINGEVFVATYPGCRVARYHPTDGFKEISNGPCAENENYARSIAYDATRNKIYIGVGSHPHLIELDPATGKKTDLLPKEFQKNEFVYTVRIVGDRLYAVVTNANKCLVFNLKTREFEKTIDDPPTQLVITKSPTSDDVYFAKNGKLYSYNPATPDQSRKEVLSLVDARAMTWIDNRLTVFSRYAQVLRYNPADGTSASNTLQAPAEPTPIQSIHLGPDGKIWTGGYLSGGNASYDPATGKSEEHKGLSQSESIATLGNALYFGLYPGAKFATYDTTKPWDAKSKNPRQIGSLEGQSRPFGGLGVPSLNKVFFGLVPEYGLVGGGLATFDPATDKLSFQHNLITNHSIVSLAFANDLLIGGTSIWGGLGIKPAEKEAKLFLYDPKSREKIFETVPVPGANAISGLITGPDQNIWGLADGTLFIFDVPNRKIVSIHELMKIDYKGNHVWRGGFLVLHKSGQIFGTLDERLFSLDPQTKKITILRKDANLLTQDQTGTLYFRDKINLWSYTP
jgi:hypothetical protein